jgi:flagellar motor switch protein FliG
MGKIKKIPVTAYREIAERLTKKALQVEKIKYVTTDGVEALIKLLEESSPEVEEQILASITAQDVNLANEIRKMYVTFSELPVLPDKVLAEILRGIDREIITKALIDAEPAVKQKIIANLPPRLRIIVEDTVKTLEEEGGVPLEEIHSARKTITRRIRELIRTGKLDIRKYVG